MVRLVLGGNEIGVDLAGGAVGRGAHVHARSECVAKACKGNIARSFGANVRVDAAGLGARIAEACDRRIAGLLLAARRTRALAIGADATLEAIDAGAPLVVVAVDAASVAKKSSIARAVETGRAVAWGVKAELGALLGTEEVALCAILHAGIAAEVKKTRAMADAVGTRSTKCWSLEAR
jgi:ribosomal protein L7Ae-like RNA K-turn-binding protein